MIAEEMAAREALKKIMKTDDSRAPLILGRMADTLSLDHTKVNISAEDVIKQFYSSSQQKTASS